MALEDLKPQVADMDKIEQLNEAKTGNCQLLVSTMASYQFLNPHQGQVRNSSFSSCSTNNGSGHGFSKSQMCLHKILDIIASYPPRETVPPPHRQIDEFKEKRGIGIDLNLGLSPCYLEEEDVDYDLNQESGSLSSSSLVEEDKVFRVEEEKSSEGECDGTVGDGSSRNLQEIGEELLGVRNRIDDHKLHNEVEEPEDGIKDDNDNEDGNGRNITEASQEEEETEEKQRRYNSGCFSLLIEAAELVSSGQEKKAKVPECVRGGSRRMKSSSSVRDLCGDVDHNKTPMVMRSKRGRSQVLPHRFRDSFLLDPWKRLSSLLPLQQQQNKLAASATRSAVVSTKRKSR